MRVLINAQLDPAASGGIAQAVLGLVYGLGRLETGDEYVLVCSPRSADFLRPFTGENQRIVINERRTPAPQRGVRSSDGFFESFHPDVIHFPYQSYTHTNVPSVFNPHDLQHIHLPECFSREECARRESLYEEACRCAEAIVTASQWARGDFINHYHLDPAGVRVIPWSPPVQAYPRPTTGESKATLQHWNLAPGFAFYPAQTWPHKNHAELLHALLQVRDVHALEIPLVCCGTHTDHHAELASLVTRHSLGDHVRFLGRIGEKELVTLYRSARFVILPTRFEAGSLPVLEAFAENVPVACSSLPPLVEQFGGAVHLFDPRSIDQLANALRRMYEDHHLREDLISRGKSCLTSFSWQETARGYRNLYHSVRATGSPRAHLPAGAES